MMVSALIPTYNRRKYVVRAIESILAQTVGVDEIVVVDDGSTDGTAEEIETRFGARVRLIRQENRGVSGARRRAVEEARGKWIAFLDSDDEWLPDRNRELLEAVEKMPGEVAWVFGDMQVITDGGGSKSLFDEFGLNVPRPPHIFEDSFSIQHPFQFCMFQNSLIRREALLDIDCFSAGLKSDDDLLTGYQIACRYKFAAITSVVTKFFRTSDLFASSVEYNGRNGVDYYRARMMACSLAVEAGKKNPWAEDYAHQVRGLSKLLANKRQGVRRLALQQFRYSVSLKSLAFFAAALFGHPGIRAWGSVRQLLPQEAGNGILSGKLEAAEAGLQPGRNPDKNN